MEGSFCLKARLIVLLILFGNSSAPSCIEYVYINSGMLLLYSCQRGFLRLYKGRTYYSLINSNSIELNSDVVSKEIMLSSPSLWISSLRVSGSLLNFFIEYSDRLMRCFKWFHKQMNAYYVDDPGGYMGVRIVCLVCECFVWNAGFVCHKSPPTYIHCSPMRLEVSFLLN